MGALNPEMLALAGEVADGVLLNYLPASHVPWSVEQMPGGGDATVYAYVHAGVCGARTASSRPRATSSRTRWSTRTRRTSNGPATATTVAEVRERHAAGDREGALAAVSDDMVDGIDVMGDADPVRGTVKAYVDAGVEVPILMPLPWGGPPAGHARGQPDDPRRRSAQGSSSGTTRPSGSSSAGGEPAMTTWGASSGL